VLDGPMVATLSAHVSSKFLCRTYTGDVVIMDNLTGAQA
jgi:hypothetical protein